MCEAKRKDEIIEQVFRIWVSTFGLPKKFLVDKSGEFSNDDFFPFCKNANICVLTTAAEFHWSKILIQKHNSIWGYTATKTTVDTGCDLKLDLSSAVVAKDSLLTMSEIWNEEKACLSEKRAPFY